MPTIKSDIIGTGDDEYTEFVDNMATQLDGFRESDEPSIEFARRYVGLCATHFDQGIKRKKLKLA